MKKIAVIFLAAGSLAGCSSMAQLTPAQEAALFCVVSGGAVQAVAASNSAAAKVANSYSGSQVVACNTATQVGQILTH